MCLSSACCYFFAAFTLLQKRKNKAQVTSFVESYVLYYTGTTF